MATANAASAPPPPGGVLGVIEKIGNKVPHPVVMFLYLIAFVIVLSQILYWFDVSVTTEIAVHEDQIIAEPPEGADGDEPIVDNEDPLQHPPPPNLDESDYVIVTETIEVNGLLTTDGIRFIFSSFVRNFANFTVVATIFVAMIGVGVAEEAGLMGALIRKLVKVAPRWALAFIIILVGGLSSIATDAGYLILIPLGAAAFLSVGRHPLAGLAAAYAGVSAAFAVNVLITPADALVTEMTNEAIQIATPGDTISVVANLYFNIVSTIAMALVITFVTERLIEPRLGKYTAEPAVDTIEAGTPASSAGSEVKIEPAAEARGLKYALYAVFAAAAVIVLLTVFPDAPLRDPETGDIIGTSPFMDSLIFLITLMFLAAGIAFGIGAGTIETSNDVIAGVTKTFASLAGLIFMLLIISQFIAQFNYTNMPTLLATGLADLLERADVSALPLLIGFILVIMLLDIIIPGVLPKWAIFAPIFIPLFIELDVAPQTVLAAYRIGDSPMNVITPLMVYLPLIIIVAQRYQRDAGIGTIMSLMIPYTLVVAVTWIILFIIWYLLGIPLGPGYPVEV